MIHSSKNKLIMCNGAYFSSIGVSIDNKYVFNGIPTIFWKGHNQVHIMTANEMISPICFENRLCLVRVTKLYMAKCWKLAIFHSLIILTPLGINSNSSVWLWPKYHTYTPYRVIILCVDFYNLNNSNFIWWFCSTLVFEVQKAMGYFFWFPDKTPR